MRVLIVSDIHGFNSYMEKLLDIIVNTKPDKIVLLGDIKYNYLQTDILNKLCLFKDKIIAVKGNCDDKNDIRAVIRKNKTQDIIDIDIKDFMNDFLSMLSNNHISLPKDVTMLMRGIIVLEGVLRTVSPQINLIQILKTHIPNI